MKLEVHSHNGGEREPDRRLDRRRAQRRARGEFAIASTAARAAVEAELGQTTLADLAQRAQPSSDTALDDQAA